MTQLLTHSVAHSTRPFSRPKTNNQSIKKFWLMENLDKELPVPKWVLINQPKIPQMPQNLSAQIVCPSQKDWDFDKKKRASLGVRTPWWYSPFTRYFVVIISLFFLTKILFYVVFLTVDVIVEHIGISIIKSIAWITAGYCNHNQNR